MEKNMETMENTWKNTWNKKMMISFFGKKTMEKGGNSFLTVFRIIAGFFRTIPLKFNKFNARMIKLCCP